MTDIMEGVRSPGTRKAIERLLAGEWLSGTDFAEEEGTYPAVVNSAVAHLKKQGVKIGTRTQGLKKFYGVRSRPGAVAVPATSKEVVPFRWLDIPEALPRVGQLVQVVGHLHSSTRGTILVLRAEDGHTWSVTVTDVSVPGE